MTRRYITNTSVDDRAYADAVALIIAIDRVLQEMQPLDREEFEGRLERHGAAQITATSLRILAEELPFPTVEINDDN
jgi:hypothetical protein